MAKQVKISDLTFDDKNFNKHTEFGMSLLEKSLRNNGAGRSILIDKNNRIIGGNGVVEVAGQIGLNNVRIIESDGSEIIAVKRTDIDLDSKQGREMALADNATASADLAWDEEQIQFAEEEFGFVAEEWGVQLDDNFNPTNSEISVDDFADKIKMEFQFTIEENAFVTQELSKIDANKELAILKLLGYEPQV